jgi:mannose-6-phosphate isomerase-like protein (cupin superfamily)
MSMSEFTRPRVIRLAEAESFMEGDEHCRHYVSTGKVTFGTSSLQPGQRGAVDTGHPRSHEVFFCVRGHVLVHTGGREHFELWAGDAIVIPEGVPHTLINVGDEPALLSWSAGPTP